MDRFEYKVRAEEIRALVQNREYQEAVAIADTIDWRRVKSVLMLCTVSDLYKLCRRYEESRDLLLMAYERHPGGRMIVYSLCELAIKMQEVVQAIEYYKEFVQIAPKDSGRYVLQYKLYVAQQVSLDERISVLEEFKKRDFREKWAYELAVLYQRTEDFTKCVEICDEIILYFGDGRYVQKAKALRALHCPEDRQETDLFKELGMVEVSMPIEVSEKEAADEKTIEIPSQDTDFQVKTVKVGEYDTINLQKELAESMQELLGSRQAPGQKTDQINEDDIDLTQAMTAPMQDETAQIPGEEVFFEDSTAEMQAMEVNELPQPMPLPSIQPVVEKQIHVPTLPEGQPEINTMDAVAKEYQGQIKNVLLEGANLDKQMTGQICIEDILAEWERIKKENEQKLAQEVKQRVLRQTGPLFSEFDEKTKSGILAQLNELSEEVANAQDFGEVEELEEIQEISPTENMPKVEEMLQLQKQQGANTSISQIKTENMPQNQEVIADQLTENDQSLVSAEYPEDNSMESNSFEESAVEEPTGEEEKQEIQPEGQAAQQDEEQPVRQPVRSLTEEEIDLFGSFIQTKKEKAQIIHTIDTISLVPYTGNVIITGEMGSSTLDLAKSLIKEVQLTDDDFSGKVAKITGKILNSKNIESTLGKMKQGALIIERAGDLSQETLDEMYRFIENDDGGIILIIEDTPKAIKQLFKDGHKIEANFNARIDIAALDNNALVEYARRYARELEYSIDELGVLALYTRIAEMQTSDHIVSAAEIREIIDDAISHANRKNFRHLLDILLAKRYDKNDMIILRERDFN